MHSTFRFAVTIIAAPVADGANWARPEEAYETVRAGGASDVPRRAADHQGTWDGVSVASVERSYPELSYRATWR